MRVLAALMLLASVSVAEEASTETANDEAAAALLKKVEQKYSNATTVQYKVALAAKRWDDEWKFSYEVAAKSGNRHFLSMSGFTDNKTQVTRSFVCDGKLGVKMVRESPGAPEACPDGVGALFREAFVRAGISLSTGGLFNSKNSQVSGIEAFLISGLKSGPDERIADRPVSVLIYTIKISGTEACFREKLWFDAGSLALIKREVQDADARRKYGFEEVYAETKFDEEIADDKFMLPHQKFSSMTPTGKPTAAAWPPLPTGDEKVAHAFQTGVKDFERGDFDAALGVFDEVLRLQAGCWPAELGKGMALACLDRNEEAEKSITKVLESHPELGGARTYRAWALEKHGSSDRATSEFDLLIKSSPDDNWLRTNRGWIALRVNAVEKAIADFEAVLELKPEDALARIGKASAYAMKGDKKQALETLSGLSSEEIPPPEIAACMAVALSLAGKKKEAMKTAKSAVDSTPHNEFAWNSLGWLLREDSDSDVAEKEFSDLIVKHPGQPAAYYERGVLRSRAYWRNLQGTLDDFTKAWKLDPGHFAHLFERLQVDLVASTSGDDVWNRFRAELFEEVAIRTGATTWARSWLDTSDGKLIEPKDRRWMLVRIEVADRNFKKAVTLLDENFEEFHRRIEAMEAGEEFRDFCASAEYHDWKFPPAKK